MINKYTTTVYKKMSIRGLKEAYQEVYLNESIENLAIALIEEGYDLDQITEQDFYNICEENGFICEGGKAKALLDLLRSPAARRVYGKAYRGLVKPVVGGAKRPLKAALGVLGATAATKYGLIPAVKYAGGELKKGLKSADDALGGNIQKMMKGGDSNQSKPVKKKEEEDKDAWMNKYLTQGDSEDMFDLVKNHLLDEGYADTENAAIVIMSNMSEEWRKSILEGSIADRARKVVDAQRQGFHGDADEMKRDMDAINLNLLRLRPYGVKGFPSVKKNEPKKTTNA